MIYENKYLKYFAGIFAALIILLAAFFMPLNLHAAQQEDTDDANSAAFGVKAILPENQQGGASYFNLKMNPGQKQVVSVELFSLSGEDHTIYVSLLNGFTNNNGAIDYGVSGQKLENGGLRFTGVARTAENEILLPAGESVIVDIALEMPPEGFDGSILGGIHFLRKADEGETSGGAAFTNDFAYLIGAVLFENEAAVPSELEFEGISPEIINYTPTLVLGINNVQPNIEKDMILKVDIYKEGNVVLTHENDNVSFAPNSHMDYYLPVEANTFEAGEYTAAVHMESTNGERWDAEFPFTVSGQTEDDFSQLATAPVLGGVPAAATAQPQAGKTPVWVYVTVIIAALLVVEIVFFAIYKNRRAKRLQKQRETRRAYMQSRQPQKHGS